MTASGLRKTGRTADGRYQVYDPTARKLVYRDSWDEMSVEEQAWFLKRHPELREATPQEVAVPEPDFDEPEHIAELRAFIASYREEIAEISAERRRTTDVPMRSRLLERINQLQFLVALHEEAITVDPTPQKYGHDRSERFQVPVPGREPIIFYGHMYTASDLIEKTILERLVGKERGLRRITALERPFWSKESGDFHGWDTVSRIQASGASLDKYRTF